MYGRLGLMLLHQMVIYCCICMMEVGNKIMHQEGIHRVRYFTSTEVSDKDAGISALTMICKSSKIGADIQTRT